MCQNRNFLGIPAAQRIVSKGTRHMFPSPREYLSARFEFQSSDFNSRLEKMSTTRLDNLLTRRVFNFLFLPFKYFYIINKFNYQMNDKLIGCITKATRLLDLPSISWLTLLPNLGQQTKQGNKKTRHSILKPDWNLFETWRNIDSNTRLLRYVLFMM